VSKLSLFLWLAAVPAWANGPATFAVRSGTLSYKLVHKFHEIVGVSKRLEAKARLLPDGAVQVMARAPIDSFDSGNGNRDAHMLEVVEGATYRVVEFKGVSSGLSLPQKFPATLKVSLHGLLTFHGVQQEKTIDATLTFADTDHLRVASSFPLSLDSFRVERPSLMFVRVEDKVVLDADLSMARER
jgi:polyisoprenoid-binding protein YceI